MCKCYYCGHEIGKDEEYMLEWINGEHVHICADCRDERYVCCRDCGSYILKRDSYVVNTGFRDEFRVCEDCIDNYTKCDCCEEYYSDDHIYLRDDDMAICSFCSSDYYYCDDCGRIIHIDDSYENDGCYYCSECYRENGYGDIHDYGYKPYDYDPVYWKTDEDKADEKLFFGIEQETDSGHNRSDYAEELMQYSQDEQLFVMKEDCSLTNGVEIVSYPCTFNYFMNKYPFEQIRDTARKYGYVSHDSGNCGLHIHVSRAGLGDNSTEQDLVIAKIMLLYDRFWDNIFKFSRRKDCSWCHKPNAQITGEDTPEQAIQKTKKNYWSHSMAVNLQHNHTVEFRIFRGTLNVDTMKASIQFTKVLVDWAIKHTLRECQSVSWQDLVFSEYTELNNYLAEHGLN